MNIAIDWYCALLPVPLLWNAPLSLRTKLSVGFLLSLGILASVSACVRQKYTAALYSSQDVTYSLGNLMIWGCECRPCQILDLKTRVANPDMQTPR